MKDVNRVNNISKTKPFPSIFPARERSPCPSAIAASGAPPPPTIAEKEEIARKMQQDKFDFNDMLDQLNQVRRMGDIKGMLGMLPGVGKQLQDVDIDERQFDRVKAIILSMTPAEREKPDLINPSRKRRIAAGSGMKVEDVNRLIKQYDTMRQMMKQRNNQ